MSVCLFVCLYLQLVCLFVCLPVFTTCFVCFLAVKGVNYFGLCSEYVVSGSDCGHVFMWDKQTQKIVQYFEGDKEGVVCEEEGEEQEEEEEERKR